MLFSADAGVTSMMEEARRTPPCPTSEVNDELLLLLLFAEAVVVLSVDQHLKPTMGVEGYTSDRRGWLPKTRRRPPWFSQVFTAARAFVTLPGITIFIVVVVVRKNLIQT